MVGGKEGKEPGGFDNEVAVGGGEGEEESGGLEDGVMVGGNEGEEESGGFDGKVVAGGREEEEEPGGWEEEEEPGGWEGEEEPGGREDGVTVGRNGEEESGGFDGEIVAGGEEGEEVPGGWEDETTVDGEEGKEETGGFDDEMVVGGREGEEESVGLEDKMVVGGWDEGSMVNELGVEEGGNVDGSFRLEEGTDVKDVREEMETLVNVDVGIILSFVEEAGGREEENRVELGFVIEDDGGVTDEEILGEVGDTELELIADEDDGTEVGIEDDALDLDGETVELETAD